MGTAGLCLNVSQSADFIADAKLYSLGTRIGLLENSVASLRYGV